MRILKTTGISHGDLIRTLVGEITNLENRAYIWDQGQKLPADRQVKNYPRINHYKRGIVTPDVITPWDTENITHYDSVAPASIVIFHSDSANSSILLSSIKKMLSSTDEFSEGYPLLNRYFPIIGGYGCSIFTKLSRSDELDSLRKVQICDGTTKIFGQDQGRFSWTFFNIAEFQPHMVDKSHSLYDVVTDNVCSIFVDADDLCIFPHNTLISQLKPEHMRRYSKIIDTSVIINGGPGNRLLFELSTTYRTTKDLSDNAIINSKNQAKKGDNRAIGARENPRAAARRGRSPDPSDEEDDEEDDAVEDDAVEDDAVEDDAVEDDAVEDSADEGHAEPRARPRLSPAEAARRDKGFYSSYRPDYFQKLNISRMVFRNTMGSTFMAKKDVRFDDFVCYYPYFNNKGLITACYCCGSRLWGSNYIVMEKINNEPDDIPAKCICPICVHYRQYGSRTSAPQSSFSYVIVESKTTPEMMIENTDDEHAIAIRRMALHNENVTISKATPHSPAMVTVGDKYTGVADPQKMIFNGSAKGINNFIFRCKLITMGN